MIIGFCLYLVDREDLFKIAYKIDRVLKINGTIIILDFFPEHNYFNNYAYDERIKSFKMDYSKLFLWNPAYSSVFFNSFSHFSNAFCNIEDERIAISVLQKTN